MSLLKTLQRQFNVVNVAGDDEFSHHRAQVLASLTDGSFIVAVARFKQMGDTEGGDLYISAVRSKFDADGQEIPKEEHRDTVGNYETIGFEIVYKVNEETETLELQCLEPLDQVEILRAQAEGMVLAEIADAEFIKAVTDLRVILERFGGQVRVIAARSGEQTTGYIFSYERRDAPLLVSAYPVLDPEEQAEASKTSETDPEPEAGKVVETEGDPREIDPEDLKSNSEAEKTPVTSSG